MNSIFRIVDIKGKNINKLYKQIQNPKSNIILDSHGIQIKLVDTEEDTSAAINSHIPYKFITNNLLDNLLKVGFIDNAQLHQIKVEISKYQLDEKNYKKSTIENYKELASILGIKNTNSSELGKEIAHKIINDPKSVAKLVVDNNLNIPSPILEELKNIEGKDATFFLLKLAEEINISLSNTQLIESLDSLDSKKEVLYNYSKRRSTLDNNPLGKTIYNCVDLGLGIDNSNHILYKYNIKEGSKSVVLGGITQDGTTRNLLNKEKFNSDCDEHVEEINELQYKNIEIFFQDYQLIEKEINNLSTPQLNKDGIKEILESSIIFALSYLGKDYNSIINKVSDIRNNISDIDKINHFQKYYLSILEGIKENWKETISYDSNLESSDQLLKTTTLKFDNDYIEKIKKSGIPGSKYDLDVTQSGEEIKIAEIKLNSEDLLSGSNFQINGLQEILAIKALGLNDNKPLEVISGGCASTDEKDIENFYQFTKEALIRGIKNGSNIAIVGNQSTAGILASKAIAELKKSNQYFSSDSVGKVFAVSTLGNMFYGENELGKATDEIPSDCDIIGIMMDPDWSAKGIELISSNYMQFLEMQNQIFNSLSSKHGRNHNLTNGGLFSVVEAIGSARNKKSKIILNKSGGRFSSAASNMFKSIKSDPNKIIDFNQSQAFSSIGNIRDRLQEINSILKIDMSKYYNEWQSKDFGNIESLTEVFSELQKDDYSIGSIDDIFIDVCKKAEEKEIEGFQPKEFLYQLKFLELISIIVSDSNKLDSIQ